MGFTRGDAWLVCWSGGYRISHTSTERRREIIMGKNSRKMIAFHLATYICLCCCSCVQRRRIEKKPEVVSRPSRREEHAKEQQQEPLRAEENYTSSFRVQILAYWIFFLANSTTTRRHSFRATSRHSSAVCAS